MMLAFAQGPSGARGMNIESSAKADVALLTALLGHHCPQEKAKKAALQTKFIHAEREFDMRTRYCTAAAGSSRAKGHLGLYWLSKMTAARRQYRPFRAHSVNGLKFQFLHVSGLLWSSYVEKRTSRNQVSVTIVVVHVVFCSSRTSWLLHRSVLTIRPTEAEFSIEDDFF